jgi:hypothetical protein
VWQALDADDLDEVLKDVKPAGVCMCVCVDCVDMCM